jgi:hypothetical protein
MLGQRHVRRASAVELMKRGREPAHACGVTYTAGDPVLAPKPSAFAITGISVFSPDAVLSGVVATVEPTYA